MCVCERRWVCVCARALFSSLLCLRNIRSFEPKLIDQRLDTILSFYLSIYPFRENCIWLSDVPDHCNSTTFWAAWLSGSMCEGYVLFLPSQHIWKFSYADITYCSLWTNLPTPRHWASVFLLNAKVQIMLPVYLFFLWMTKDFFAEIKIWLTCWLVYQVTAKPDLKIWLTVTVVFTELRARLIFHFW